MSEAKAASKAGNNEDVITLFAIIALAAGLISDIVGVAFGKIPSDIGALVGGQLATFLSGVAAYYLMD